FIASARTDGDDFAFLRLFLGGVRNDDATLGLFFRLDAAYDDAVMKGAEIGACHCLIPRSNDICRPGEGPVELVSTQPGRVLARDDVETGGDRVKDEGPNFRSAILLTSFPNSCLIDVWGLRIPHEASCWNFASVL